MGMILLAGLLTTVALLWVAGSVLGLTRVALLRLTFCVVAWNALAVTLDRLGLPLWATIHAWIFTGAVVFALTRRTGGTARVGAGGDRWAVRAVRAAGYARGRSVDAGMAVYDASGDKVGAVRAANPRRDYLVVRHGWLFPCDIYVPLHAIAHTDAEGIILRLGKDELRTEVYRRPPIGPAIIYEGASGAMPGGRRSMREGEVTVGARQDAQGSATRHGMSHPARDERVPRIGRRAHDVAAIVSSVRRTMARSAVRPGD